MPAKTKKQQRTAYMAEACKSGKKKSCKGTAKEMAKMGWSDLVKFTKYK